MCTTSQHNVHKTQNPPPPPPYLGMGEGGGVHTDSRNFPLMVKLPHFDLAAVAN